MPFSGKSTYSAGPTLPELAQDVSDIIGIVSPYETPLLDHLGDPQRSATSTVHEWLEDTLLPNTDAVDGAVTISGTSVTVDNGSRFRVGDQVQPEGSREVLFVTAISSNTLTVVRGYGSTTAGVEVSGSQLASRQLALADEMDYQKQERLRELVRDLENCVINGAANTSGNPMGDAATRRTMRGIISSLSTNIVDGSSSTLDEETLNAALRDIWETSSGSVDTIVVSGTKKRAINGFITAARGFGPAAERFKDLVSVYESDFGVCRVVLSRWVPRDSVLLLDSSRIDVFPLSARSFQYKPLAATGDSESGQVIGEYTLELRNENAHGLIRNLSA